MNLFKRWFGVSNDKSEKLKRDIDESFNECVKEYNDLINKEFMRQERINNNPTKKRCDEIFNN